MVNASFGGVIVWLKAEDPRRSATGVRSLHAMEDDRKTTNSRRNADDIHHYGHQPNMGSRKILENPNPQSYERKAASSEGSNSCHIGINRDEKYMEKANLEDFSGKSIC